MTSPYLPEPASDRTPSIRSVFEIKRAERAVASHEIQAARLLAFEQIDAAVSADASRINLDEELTIWAYGRAKAGSDPVATALVLNKVDRLSLRNDRRLMRRFG